MQTKVCTKCKLEKDLSGFRVTSKRGSPCLHSWCKCCERLSKDKWRATKLGIDSQRKSDLKKNYGITTEQYEHMLQDQNFSCKICNMKEDFNDNVGRGKRKLCVDHCHKTGAVRGLLCSRCNSMIGYAKESASILNSAIEYLNA